MSLTLNSTQPLTAIPSATTFSDAGIGTFAATLLQVASTTPAIIGGLVTIAEGATSEDARIISVTNSTNFVVEQLVNIYTTAALVTFKGFSNPGDPLGQTIVKNAANLKLNGSKNKAETFWNVLVVDVKGIWQWILDFAVDKSIGNFTASTLTIKSDATVNADRSLVFKLTSTLSRVLRYNSSTGRMRLEDQAGALVALEAGDASQATQLITKQQLDAALAAIVTVPSGAVLEWYEDTLPSGGYLWANGQAVSRTTYATLFAKWGTQFGAGDGSTTFNVIDRRECASIGKGTMGGTTSPGRITAASTGGGNASTLGGRGGEETSALSAANNGPHSHSASNVNSTSIGGTAQASGSSGAGYGTVSTSSSGTGTAFNNMPPYMVSNYIIKT